MIRRALLSLLLLVGLALPGQATFFDNAYVSFPSGGTLTKLLLHMDGSDASTTFTDSSSAAHTVTAVGNAQIDTAQSKFGGASGLFDGTGDYLTLDGSADFTFGTGDFTVDFWIRPNAITGQHMLYSSGAGQPAGFTVYLTNSDSKIHYFDHSATEALSSGTLSTGTWYHVAVVRSSGTVKVYLNGTGGTGISDTTSKSVSASEPRIGDYVITPGSYFNGWMDELRVSKGTARWTSNFTPPTSAYTAD